MIVATCVRVKNSIILTTTRKPVFHDLVSLGVREDGLGEVWTGALEYLLLAGFLVVLTSRVFSCRLLSEQLQEPPVKIYCSDQSVITLNFFRTVPQVKSLRLFLPFRYFSPSYATISRLIY